MEKPVGKGLQRAAGSEGRIPGLHEPTEGPFPLSNCWAWLPGLYHLFTELYKRQSPSWSSKTEIAYIQLRVNVVATANKTNTSSDDYSEFAFPWREVNR